MQVYNYRAISLLTSCKSGFRANEERNFRTPLRYRECRIRAKPVNVVGNCFVDGMQLAPGEGAMEALKMDDESLLQDALS